MKAILSGLLVCITASVAVAAKSYNAREASYVACKAAANETFDFETSCPMAFAFPWAESDDEYFFAALNVAGECAMTVAVEKQSGETETKITCNDW